MGVRFTSLVVLIALLVGGLWCSLEGSSRAEELSRPAKNKICYGDSVDVVLVGDGVHKDLRLTVPTRYFTYTPIYRGAEQMYRESRFPDPWPKCADEPIRLSSLGVPLSEGLLVKDNPENIVDRTGTALAGLPKASLDWVGIKVGPMRTARGTTNMGENDKIEYRSRFDKQRMLGNIIKTDEILERVNTEAPPYSGITRMYFGTGNLVEPSAALPIIFNCQSHIWGDVGNKDGSPHCAVLYELDSETGLWIDYWFLETLMPKNRWEALDQNIRQFFIDMISDHQIRARLQKAVISP